MRALKHHTCPLSHPVARTCPPFLSTTVTHACSLGYQCIHHSRHNGCHAEEEKAAAAAEAAAASAREATPEVSEEGEIAVDPEELEEISKAQQQAASKQANPHPQPHHHPAAKQASDRGHDRDRDRGADRDRGHPGQERQALGVHCCRHCPHLAAAHVPCDHDSCLAQALLPGKLLAKRIIRWLKRKGKLGSLSLTLACSKLTTQAIGRRVVAKGDLRTESCFTGQQLAIQWACQPILKSNIGGISI